MPEQAEPEVQEFSDGDLAYIGNSHGLERELVTRTGIRCSLFPMAPPSSATGVGLLVLATFRSAAVLMRFRPNVTFATGGYASVPCAVASWLLRIPLVVFLPDAAPGKAVRLLAPMARTIAVSTEDVVRLLPERKTVVTGYPVREWFRTVSRKAGRERFAIPDRESVICVFGGSLGARSINQALGASLPSLLESVYVLHIAGEQRMHEAELASSGLSSEQKARYRLYPYLHDEDMALALAAADLVICRSGASTLGELPAVGVPAILVPLPHTSVNQASNAEFLARHGAAVVIPDGELAARLGPCIDMLLGDPERLRNMASASRALARPEAAERIASLIRGAGR
ncbi:MAG: UDP-N-acetylglucosamine--N-acetylmuramyl-(pentapeptide) pyrophosphoryl-undecaprenol N-acetylglucosamine transferase [Chloroflexota bacterium]